MTWFKVDDRYFSHPKVLQLPMAARGLWLTAGTWASAYLTDGRITRTALRSLITADPTRHLPGLIGHLLESGMWLPDEDHDGFIFHDWSDYQPTRSAVETARQADADRKRRGREAQHLRPVRPESDRT